MPVPPRSTRRILVVTVTAAMLLASVAPPLVGAGTYQDPEIVDDCLDAGIGPLSAVPQLIADVDRAWWVHDPGDATLELHLALCSDLPGDDERRALEQVLWSVEWTDPSNAPWKANLWLDGLGEPGSERLRLCKDGLDVTDREGGLGEVRREEGNTTHWIVEIDNAADTTSFVGTLTDFTVLAGQYGQSTACHQGFTTFHDRAPDDGSGAPFTLAHADLTAGEIGASPTDALAGETVTLSVPVENTGSNRSDGFDVAFRIDGTLQSTVRVGSLDPGASRIVEADPWVATGGVHTIRADVDPDDEITEIDETDNAAEDELTIADVDGEDLEVFDLERTPTPTTEGDETQFTARVRNVGTDATPTSLARFRLDGDLLGEATIPALSTYEVAEIASDNWTATLGNHTVEALADPDDTIAEADETNNAIDVAFEVVTSPPNLNLTELSADPEVPGPGEPATASATVLNDGADPSEATVVRFLLDGDLLSEEEVPSLAPGASATVESPSFEHDDGDHTVEAIVDPDDSIEETDETDNDGTVTVSVRTWPTLNDAAIRPGAVLTQGGGQCTTAFVFSSPDNGTLYISTASHCVSGLDVGDTVTIAGRTDAGVVAYCSWMHTENSDICYESPDGTVEHPNDFALIRIRDTYRSLVHPAVRHWGGPTGLGDVASFGDHVLTYGNSGLRPGDPADPREGIVTGQSRWTTTTYFAPPSIPGDSGSAMITADGEALGVLSGLGLFPTAGSNTWTRVDEAVEYAEARTDLDVELKTWRMLQQPNLPAT